MWYEIYGTSVAVIALAAFFIGRKLAAAPKTESKTTTQTIAAEVIRYFCRVSNSSPYSCNIRTVRNVT